ncbi:acetoin utilization protein AcuC [Longibacter salinarum]|uniref:Acetoin utilization protein AcuC n=1 Tax=Longibacter salinarum TaxID=1850348 RepID=A0A2A8CY43_9BACT|nr:acetoin utilization protein AcuC [Longibacter salinarum]PEN13615.1 acetoin utilization protein AcuC [Longibacter salinarum]
MSTTVLSSPRYRDYDFGPEHPFSPVRLEMLMDLLEHLDVDLDMVEPPLASTDDILTVHAEKFVRQVEAASGGTPGAAMSRYGLGTADVPIFDGMDEAARSLVGGTLHGAERIEQGEATRVLQLGGGLHHAQEKLASGFCVYNDLSVAIQHLRDAGRRVAYLDIDVHHGDGVQALHYDDPNVLTISLHESGRYLFPGTGTVHEIGKGAGEGTSLNVPLEPFTEADSYLDVFERVVPYAIENFMPEVMVVQCGADAHFSDPLADLLLDTHVYETLFDHIFDLADDHCNGRLLLTLGGGYQMDATVRIWTLLALKATGHPIPDALPDAWLANWKERLGEDLTPTLHDAPDKTFDIPRKETIYQQNQRVSKRVLELLAPLWY